MEDLNELVNTLQTNLERDTDPAYLRVLFSYATFLRYLAELKAKQKEDNDAQELHLQANSLLKEILDLDDRFGPAYAHLAYYFINHLQGTKQMEDANKLLEKARMSSYLEPDMLTYQAKVLHELGQFEQAFELASLALKVNPQNFDAYVIRGHYQHKRRLERAPHYKKRGRRKKTEINPAEAAGSHN